MKGTKPMMNQEMTNHKSQGSIRNVEHAFVVKLRNRDVLFVQAEGLSPMALKLPNGFLAKLKAEIGRKELFPLGKTFITPGAAEALDCSGETAEDFLARHRTGDWGLVGKDDWNENDISVSLDLKILSAYRTTKGERLWVITEADRSYTTVLLPDEY
jgi:hypothetical protein